jgi:hypothetical protein
VSDGVRPIREDGAGRRGNSHDRGGWAVVISRASLPSCGQTLPFRPSLSSCGETLLCSSPPAISRPSLPSCGDTFPFRPSLSSCGETLPFRPSPSISPFRAGPITAEDWPHLSLGILRAPTDLRRDVHHAARGTAHRAVRRTVRRAFRHAFHGAAHRAARSVDLRLRRLWFEVEPLVFGRPAAKRLHHPPAKGIGAGPQLLVHALRIEMQPVGLVQGASVLSDSRALGRCRRGGSGDAATRLVLIDGICMLLPH